MFSFDIVDREKILKEISRLDHTKSCQKSDKPTKIIKENVDIFLGVLHLSFNASVNEGTFPSVFKLADVTQFLRKVQKTLKIITDQSATYKICQKYLKTFCINRWLPSWINTFPNFNVALEKAI